MLGVALPSGACTGVIVVATSTDEVGRSVRELLIQLSIGVPIALVVPRSSTAFADATLTMDPSGPPPSAMTRPCRNNSAADVPAL